VLVGIACERADLTVYVFDPDESDSTVVISAGLSF